MSALRNWFTTRDSGRSLPWQPLLELSLIILWAVWLGRDYLNLSPNAIPHGREFGMAIQPQYIWTQLKECGSCVLWNGYFNGGSPAFAELHAPVLHPLVIFTTLIWGGLNGAKIALVGSLAMAGIGQWWLARVLKLGWAARIWSALMAVAGGHLAGRMEIGVTGVVLSTAACSLIIAPGIQLALSGKRRDVFPFAITLALAIVSGQGYLQLGLLVSVIPALAILIVDDRLQVHPVWKEFALAGGLALMLAAPFIVPFLHFWPQFGKDIDPYFSSVQALEHIPLNFVIRDAAYFYSDLLGKQPYPYLYMNFIGWTPVLLALLPFRLAKQSERKLLTFFGTAIVLILLASSAITFKQLGYFWPDFAASIRNPSLIAGLAVPLILGVAAWGIDLALKLDWPIMILARSDNLAHPRMVVKLSTIILLMVLVMSVRSVYTFSRSWLFTTPQEPLVGIVMDEVQLTNTQWIALPFGEHYWNPTAAEAGLKLTHVVRPSRWNDREQPQPYLEVTREDPTDVAIEHISAVSGVPMINHPENVYASVIVGNGVVEPCTAVANGGHIDVLCNTNQSGTLTVQENNWTGWRVRRDGNKVTIDDTELWLNAPAPAGRHYYEFRYVPWDVFWGLAISLAGIILTIRLWWIAKREA